MTFGFFPSYIVEMRWNSGALELICIFFLFFLNFCILLFPYFACFQGRFLKIAFVCLQVIFELWLFHFNPKTLPFHSSVKKIKNKKEEGVSAFCFLLLLCFLSRQVCVIRSCLLFCMWLWKNAP